MIVEVAGTPRSGKSAFIANLSIQLPQANVIFENFEQVPYKKPESFKFNYWYADYVVNLYEKLDTKSLNIVERGVNDRIAMGRALYKSRCFTEKQLNDYLDLLNPYINASDFLVIFNVAAEISLKNIVSKKIHFTRSKSFLNILKKELFIINSSHKNSYMLEDPNNSKHFLMSVTKLFKKD